MGRRKTLRPSCIFLVLQTKTIHECSLSCFLQVAAHIACRKETKTEGDNRNDWRQSHTALLTTWPVQVWCFVLILCKELILSWVYVFLAFSLGFFKQKMDRRKHTQ